MSVSIILPSVCRLCLWCRIAGQSQNGAAAVAEAFLSLKARIHKCLGIWMVDGDESRTDLG